MIINTEKHNPTYYIALPSTFAFSQQINVLLKVIYKSADIIVGHTMLLLKDSAFEVNVIFVILTHTSLVELKTKNLT